jgi:hypothetical protein
MAAAGRMKGDDEVHQSDIHGQLILNYRHPHIPQGAEGELMIRSFDRDFQRNGPSTIRIVRTTLAGWKRHKNHPDPRVRDRFAWESRELGTTFAAAVAGSRLYYRGNPAMFAKMSALLDELKQEFGWKARFWAAVGGPYVLWKLRREEKRLAAGWTYEPPTFYEDNDACEDRPGVARCRSTTPQQAVAPACPNKPHAPSRKPATVGT